MKKFILVLTLLVCFTSVGLADVTSDQAWDFPEDFNDQLDRTYQMIHRTNEVDEQLIFDTYLFDEYFMTLSAIARGEAVGIGLQGVQEYYGLSMQKYDLDRQFLLLVIVYDPEDRVSDREVAASVGLRNSRGQVMPGGIFDKYENVYIFTFPKDIVAQHLGNDTTFTVELGEYGGKSLETTFQANYKKKVPWKIWDLMNLLSRKDIFTEVPAATDLNQYLNN